MLRTGVQICRVIVNEKISCHVVAMGGYGIIFLLMSLIFLSKLFKSLNYRMPQFLDALEKL